VSRCPSSSTVVFRSRSSCFACGGNLRSWNLTSTYSMSGLQDVSSAFTDDDAGGHRVTGRHTGHDGSVRDTKVIDSTSRIKVSRADPCKLPGATSLFTKGRSGTELPISRQILTLAVAAFRSSWWDSVLGLIWSGSCGAGPRQVNLTSALRSHDSCEQCPGTHRRIELSCYFRAADW